MKTAAVFRSEVIEPIPDECDESKPLGKAVAIHVMELLRAKGIECEGPLHGDVDWSIWPKVDGQECMVSVKWVLPQDHDEDFWALSVETRTTLRQRVFGGQRAIANADAAVAHIVNLLEELLLTEQSSGRLSDLEWMSEEEMRAKYVF